jgi:alpha-ketoglutarate-dependent taurine dioxygenase|eukprot:SAG25_NODE_2712_length_1428_cov_0.963883_1_plen_89_part_00
MYCTHRRLYSQAENPEYQCFFKYTAGSLAFWDNRSCMHRALSNSYPFPREMRRVTIQGTQPYYSPPPPPHISRDESQAAAAAPPAARL